MENNHGYKIEDAMRKWFRGKKHPADCVDFQTSKALYEVKSCRLFIECVNGNDKRPFSKIPNKKIRTTQLGRFSVKLENHKGLKTRSKIQNKIPKYIFVLAIGKQKVWRVKSWEKIDSIMHKENQFTLIRIKDLFNEVWEDE